MICPSSGNQCHGLDEANGSTPLIATSDTNRVCYLNRPTVESSVARRAQIAPRIAPTGSLNWRNTLSLFRPTGWKCVCFVRKHGKMMRASNAAILFITVWALSGCGGDCMKPRTAEVRSLLERELKAGDKRERVDEVLKNAGIVYEYDRFQIVIKVRSPTQVAVHIRQSRYMCTSTRRGKCLVLKY